MCGGCWERGSGEFAGVGLAVGNFVLGEMIRKRIISPQNLCCEFSRG